MAITTIACQAIHLHRILENMKQPQIKVTTILCDNELTIAMTKNPIYHNHTRQINTHQHFIRELVTKGSIQMTYYSIKE